MDSLQACRVTRGNPETRYTLHGRRRRLLVVTRQQMVAMRNTSAPADINPCCSATAWEPLSRLTRFARSSSKRSRKASLCSLSFSKHARRSSDTNTWLLTHSGHNRERCVDSQTGHGGLECWVGVGWRRMARSPFGLTAGPLKHCLSWSKKTTGAE